MDLLVRAMTKAAEAMVADLYRDSDPENTDWTNAVLHVLRYTPKRQRAKRAFLKLWLDELWRNRSHGGFEGLQALYGASTTYMDL